MLIRELLKSDAMGMYVYHASYLPNQAEGLKSILTHGLRPSKEGYAGPGVYFAYDPEGGYYHTSKEEATMFRVKWSALVAKFGEYPDNNGIERDDDEIIVPGTVAANMLEVEYFPGEWWDIDSAYRASLGPIDETALRLQEAATSIVYHYCTTAAAAKILTNGVFQLSSVTGVPSEVRYTIPGHPYFLSTTRSKVGDYHRYTGSSAVMFVLDGNWLNQRYKTKPIDYWDRAWSHPDSQRSSESEDRVYSKNPEMTIGGITAVHVLLKEQHDYRSPEVRTILITAKKRGLPTYLYTDENAWRLQDIRNAVAPSAVAPLLKGQQSRGYTPSSPRRLDLEPWLELIHKSNKAELTPHAEKLRYNLVYYGSRYRDEDSNLGVDMSNARKPNSLDYPMAIKINNYMRRNKFATTVELKNALVDKWDNIK